MMKIPQIKINSDCPKPPAEELDKLRALIASGEPVNVQLSIQILSGMMVGEKEALQLIFENIDGQLYELHTFGEHCNNTDLNFAVSFEYKNLRYTIERMGVSIERLYYIEIQTIDFNLPPYYFARSHSNVDGVITVTNILKEFINDTYDEIYK